MAEDVARQAAANARANADYARAMKSALSPVKDMTDVILKAGGTNKKYINTLRANIKSMKDLDNVRGLDSTKNKALALTYLQLAQAMNKGQASATTLADMFKKTTISSGKGTKESRPIWSMLAEGLKPSEKFIKGLSFIAPSLVKGAASSKDMGLGLLKLGLYAAAADVAFKALVGAFKGAQTNAKFLANTMGVASGQMNTGADMFLRTRIQAAMFGVTAEEVSGALGELAKSFVWNRDAVRGNEAAIAGQTATYIAYAKGTGLSAEAAGQLGASLVLMGGSLGNLTGNFAVFHGALSKTGLTTDYLSRMLAALADVSMTSAVAADDLYGTLGAFKETFEQSTNPVLKFINSAGKQKLLADSMEKFASISAGLKLPELLAFGSKTAPGLSPWKALTEVMDKGQSKTGIMMNYMGALMDQTVGEEQKRFAVLTALTNKGASVDQAYVLTEAIANWTRSRASDAAKGIKDSEETKRLALAANAQITQSLGDPMERLIALVQSIGGAILRVLGMFTGGSLLSNVTGGAKLNLTSPK